MLFRFFQIASSVESIVICILFTFINNGISVCRIIKCILEKKGNLLHCCECDGEQWTEATERKQ
jgi:hypothetical protein